jgi:hypothetical protein
MASNHVSRQPSCLFNWLFGLTRFLNYFLYKKYKINKWEDISFFEGCLSLRENEMENSKRETVTGAEKTRQINIFKQR